MNISMQSQWVLFVAFVRSQLEFGNVVWSTRLEKDKKLVERFQGVQQNHSWVERSYVWAKSTENETTKHVLQKIEMWPHRSVQIHSQYLQSQWQSAWIRNNTRGHSYKLKKQRCNTMLRQHFFTQRIVYRWNSLPAEIAEAPSLNAFKNRVDLFMHDYMYSLGIKWSEWCI